MVSSPLELIQMSLNDACIRLVERDTRPQRIQRRQVRRAGRASLCDKGILVMALNG